MNSGQLYEQLAAVVPKSILKDISPEDDLVSLREIRLRIGRRAVFNRNGSFKKAEHTVAADDITSCIQLASGSSVYAFSDEIKNGFITISGGHRIGICGRAVLKKGEIINIADICGINIRIAREIIGCGSELAGYISESKSPGTLIISPPCCGKTTVLRDIARILGGSCAVSAVDERGEIAACFKGVPQFDIGEMTDVLSLCPKREGIEMMLRSMSPQYILTDEIGKDDISAIKKGLLCGVSFVVTAHGDSIEETLGRLDMADIAEQFGIIALLGDKGRIVKLKKDGVRKNDR